jgi:hypothetical protein
MRRSGPGHSKPLVGHSARSHSAFAITLHDARWYLFAVPVIAMKSTNFSDEPFLFIKRTNPQTVALVQLHCYGLGESSGSFSEVKHF